MRLTNITHEDANSNVLENFTYTYDLADRLTSQTINGTTTSYSYDVTNELTNDGTNAYTYDLNGNRTMSGYQTGADSRLLNDGTWTYSYDGEGNITKKSKGTNAETWTYGYDNENHMTWAKDSSTDGGTVLSLATYVYDVFGNRLEEDVWTPSSGTTVSRFAYMTLPSPLRGEGQGEGSSAGTGAQGGAGQGVQEIWADLNGSNNFETRYLHGDAVDQLFARVSAAGAAAWYLTDHEGSVTNLTDASGNLQDTITYDGYGNVTTESNSSFGDRFKYTGQELDSETGLQYNRARYYSATVGRWTSQDPLSFSAGDTNLYRYVNNQPTDATDPDGLQSMYPYVPRGVRAPGPNPKGDYILEANKSPRQNVGPQADVPIGGQGPANFGQFKGPSGTFQGGWTKPPNAPLPGEIQWICPFEPGRTLYFDSDGNYLGASPSPGAKGPPWQPPPGATRVPLQPGGKLWFAPGNSPDEGQSYKGPPLPGRKYPGDTIIIVPNKPPANNPSK